MTWSPLACGIVSGKYDSGIPPYSRASLKVGEQQSWQRDGHFGAVGPWAAHLSAEQGFPVAGLRARGTQRSCWPDPMSGRATHLLGHDPGEEALSLPCPAPPQLNIHKLG